MISTFFGIELGKRALLVQQMALSTVSHNIANAATPGYSRQLSSLTASMPLNLSASNRTLIPSQLGTGVDISTITRVRDMLLERQILEEKSDGSSYDTKIDYMAMVETVLQEPSDNALSTSMDAFWAAWQELSVYPEDVAVRNTLLAKAEQMLYTLQSNDNDLAQLQNQADNEYRTAVQNINTLAGRIRDLNVQINQTVGVESQPNDLKDQRDVLLRELSELVNFEGHEMSNGLYAISINGHMLVQDNTFNPIQVVNDPLNNNYAQAIWSDDGTAVAIDDGKLQGLMDMRDVYLPVYRTALDDIAQGFINTVNPIHVAGFALNAAAPSGQDFFTGTTIQDIAVNPILTADPTQIAAATNPSAPGDGSNALLIAQAQYSLTMAGGTQSLGEFYQQFVAQVGLDSQDTQMRQLTQASLVGSLINQQESNAGVNLDEEMTNMIRYQDAYQAATRVITAMDEMLDVLINRMGLVGR
ncbi:flagellar hook-associated protein FlgK [bacterium]|nr:flagellar hook-associated protein FlgK [bacterium]